MCVVALFLHFLRKITDCGWHYSQEEVSAGEQADNQVGAAIYLIVAGFLIFLDADSFNDERSNRRAERQISTLYNENLRLRASEIALSTELKREREKSGKVLAEVAIAVHCLVIGIGDGI